MSVMDPSNPFAKLSLEKNNKTESSPGSSASSQRSSDKSERQKKIDAIRAKHLHYAPTPSRGRSEGLLIPPSSSSAATSSVSATRLSSPTSPNSTNSIAGQRRRSKSQEQLSSRDLSSAKAESLRPNSSQFSISKDQPRTQSNTARVGEVEKEKLEKKKSKVIAPPRMPRASVSGEADTPTPQNKKVVSPKKLESGKMLELNIPDLADNDLSSPKNDNDAPITPPQHEWIAGAKAMAQGLQKDKHLNGKICTVEKVCPKGYVHVFFDDAQIIKMSANKGKWKLSGRNLMPVMSMFEDDSEGDNICETESDCDSEDEEVNRRMSEIENAPSKAGEKSGDALPVFVRCSPKKIDISSLPKIGKKIGKKAHLWAVIIGSDTFYARRTALVKCKLIPKTCISHGKIKKKIKKRLQEAGETRAKAMIQLAERITFQEQNSNLWVMMHFGSLF